MPTRLDIAKWHQRQMQSLQHPVGHRLAQEAPTNSLYRGFLRDLGSASTTGKWLTTVTSRTFTSWDFFRWESVTICLIICSCFPDIASAWLLCSKSSNKATRNPTPSRHCKTLKRVSSKALPQFNNKGRARSQYRKGALPHCTSKEARWIARLKDIITVDKTHWEKANNHLIQIKIKTKIRIFRWLTQLHLRTRLCSMLLTRPLTFKN